MRIIAEFHVELQTKLRNLRRALRFGGHRDEIRERVRIIPYVFLGIIFIK